MAHIASITSNIIANTADGGFYQLDVEISMHEAIASCDPQGYAKHEVARHLAGCVASTGIPLGESMWTVTFTEFAQRELGMPGGFKA